MKRLILIAALLCSTAAYADDPAPPAAAAQPGDQPITLTPADLVQIQNTLGDMPYRFAQPLMLFFQQKEMAARAAAATPAKK